ncbi:MAG: AMP-binding protein, partial [Chloroflexi bacterium]|nr:AMP-binding protein [Chloroflexota bacterium]
MPIVPLPFSREEIDTSIVDRFEKIVSTYPKSLAIKTARDKFTFLDLNQRVNQLAFKILELGEKADNTVAIFLSHNEFPIIAMMSILKAGKAFVPLNSSSPDERIKKILRSSRSEMVITDNRFIKRLSKLGLKNGKKIINMDLLSDELPDNNPGIQTNPEDLVAIIYTSGSTGVPKGVMHVQKTIMHNTWVQTDSLKIDPNDRHTLIPHLSYVAGSTDILRTLLNGASLFPIDFLDVGLNGIGRTIQNEKITIYHSVPTIFRRLIEEEAGGQDYSSVRIIHLGGEPVYAGDVRLIRKYFSKDCILLNNLGSTEVPTYRRHIVSQETKVEQGNLPVGNPVSDKKVTIVGGNGEELKPGEVGEIVIESKYMSWGYFNDPERSSKSYRPLPTANLAGRFFSG